MGRGYPKYASEAIAAAIPDVDFEFIDLGIGGNRTDQLFDRLYNDCIALDPDVVSILIGINDVWHRYGAERIATTDEQIALNYRMILERIKRETHARIVMLSPYVLDDDNKVNMKNDLKTVIPIIRELAEQYADVYIPLDEYFEQALTTQPEPKYYSADGVHPNVNGAVFIGTWYAEAVVPLVKELIK